MDRSLRQGVDAERPRPRPDSPVQMLEVVAVDVEAGTFTVDVGGVQAVLNQVGGYLPQPGAMVPLLRNGGDLVSLLQQQMVEGDLRSRTFTEGVSGWVITADGDAEFNSVLVRGDVVASSLRTSEDPTVEGAIEVFTATGANSLLFRRDGPLEDYPAHIRSGYNPNGTTYLEFSGPDETSDPKLGLSMFRDDVLGDIIGLRAQRLGGRITAEADDKIQFVSPNVTVNDLRVDQPPYLVVTRTTTQSPTNGIWQALTHTGVAKQTTDSYGDDAISIVSGNRYRPNRAGWYQATLTGFWDPTNPPVFTACGISKNGATGGVGLIIGQSGIAMGAFVPGGQGATADVWCNGTTDYIQPMVIPYAAGQAYTMRQFALRWVSD